MIIQRKRPLPRRPARFRKPIVRIQPLDLIIERLPHATIQDRDQGAEKGKGEIDGTTEALGRVFAVVEALVELIVVDCEEALFRARVGWGADEVGCELGAGPGSFGVDAAGPVWGC